MTEKKRPRVWDYKPCSDKVRNAVRNTRLDPFLQSLQDKYNAKPTPKETQP